MLILLFNITICDFIYVHIHGNSENAKQNHQRQNGANTDVSCSQSTACDEKSKAYPLTISAIFLAIALNFEAKFDTFVIYSTLHKTAKGYLITCDYDKVKLSKFFLHSHRHFSRSRAACTTKGAPC